MKHEVLQQAQDFVYSRTITPFAVKEIRSLAPRELYCYHPHRLLVYTNSFYHLTHSLSSHQ